MNQKKVKAIRKSLRQQGTDVTEREYDQIGLVRDDKDKVIFAGTFKLKQGCGRQIYQSMKG